MLLSLPAFAYSGIKDRLLTVEEELGITAKASSDIKSRIATCEKEIGLVTDDSIASLERIEILEKELGITVTDAEKESEKESEKAKTSGGNSLNTRGWYSDHYVDEFKQKNGDLYIACNFEGTFSNSATTDSLLTGKILIDEDDISIFLDEYGRNRVVNVYNEPNPYRVTILNDNGNKKDFRAAMSSNGNRVTFYGGLDDDLIDELSTSKTLSFYVVNSEYSTTTYLFSIDNTNFEKLYSLIETANFEKNVSAVEDDIDEIGPVTTESKEKIDEARASYEALSKEEKEKVSNYADLEAAEKKYLEAEAQVVIDQISSIGTVSLKSNVKIEKAREAYNSLDENVKVLVTNEETLKQAEEEYSKLHVEYMNKRISECTSVAYGDLPGLEKLLDEYKSLPYSEKGQIDPAPLELMVNSLQAVYAIANKEKVTSKHINCFLNHIPDYKALSAEEMRDELSGDYLEISFPYYYYTVQHIDDSHFTQTWYLDKKEKTNYTHDYSTDGYFLILNGTYYYVLKIVDGTYILLAELGDQRELAYLLIKSDENGTPLPRFKLPEKESNEKSIPEPETTINEEKADYSGKKIIKRVQKALNNAGYDCGKPDGDKGPKTTSAIQSYQSDNGLEITGEIDSTLLIALGLE